MSGFLNGENMDGGPGGFRGRRSVALFSPRYQSLRNRPRVLAVLPHLIPSTILTVVKPLTALHRAGQIVADITLEAWVARHKIERADIVVFSRNADRLYGCVLETALALGKPVIYDIDDDLFALPQFYHHKLDPSDKSEGQSAQLQRYISTATLVRVYAEPMRERVRQLNPHVVRVDGPVDWSLIPVSQPPRDEQKIRIVYATSRLLEDDLASLFLDDMQRLLSTYQGRIEFFCWGYHPPELQGHPAVHFLAFLNNYDKFFRRFARTGFDVGLAPLRNETFYRSKSNNKFREYAACCIAGVYSDNEVYSSCIEHERTGLLVPNMPGAWFTALARLIEDPVLRGRIQEEAYAQVRRLYSLEKTQATWLEQIRFALTHSPAPSLTTESHNFLQTDRKDAGRTFQSLPIGVEYSALKTISKWSHLLRRGRRLVASVKREGIHAGVRKFFWTWNDIVGFPRIKWAIFRASLQRSRRKAG